MNNFLILTRLNSQSFLKTFGGFNSSDSKESKRARNNLYSALAAVVLLMCFVGYIAYTFSRFGLGSLIPSVAIGFSALSCLVTSFFKAGGLLFAIKDWELLMSLPISKRGIVSAKLFSLYLSTLGLALLIALPGLVIYFVFVRASVLGILFSIFVILLTPVIPAAIGSVLSLFINWIGSHFRKINIASGVITLLLGLLFAVFYFVFLKDSLQSGISVEQLNTIGNLFKPVNWAVGAIISQNITDFASFAFFTVLLAVVVVELVNIGFYPINIRFQQKNTLGNYKLESKSLKSDSALGSLFKKEFKTLINTPSVIGNSLFGVITALVLSLTLLIMTLSGVDGISAVMSIVLGSAGSEISTMGILPGYFFGEYSPYMLLVWLLSLLTLNQAAACSMSLEGSSVWLMQTLPVSKKTVLLSKLMPSAVVYGTGFFLTSLFLAISMKLGILETISIFLIFMITCLFSTALGFYIDCKRPNFTWKSSAEVTKRGAAVMWATIPNLIVSILGFFATVFFGDMIGILLPLVLLVVSICLMKFTFDRDFAR